MKKHFKIAIQMDPLETINPKEDSTFVIAQEAQDRGYKIFHYLPKDITLKKNQVTAEGCYFKILKNKKKIFKKEKKVTKNLEDFDCILVRQDPPFNLDYITSTYFLDLLDKKVLVLNNPTEIRNNPEKLSIFNFKDLMTKTLVSENLNEIIKFIKSNQFTILKPLYGNGGEGIEKVSKSSLNNKKLILKMLNKYKSPIVAQKFIKEIRYGDRRIILFDGEYMGSVARIPKQGSIKANFPSRISFQVASKYDSRTVLGEIGAEQLLGNGDMLMSKNGGNLIRYQSAFISDNEVNKLIKEIKSSQKVEYLQELDEIIKSGNENFDTLTDEDEALVTKSIDLIKNTNKASTSFLQRNFQIG